MLLPHLLDLSTMSGLVTTEGLKGLEGFIAEGAYVWLTCHVHAEPRFLKNFLHWGNFWTSAFVHHHFQSSKQIYRMGTREMRSTKNEGLRGFEKSNNNCICWRMKDFSSFIMLRQCVATDYLSLLNFLTVLAKMTMKNLVLGISWLVPCKIMKM